MASSSWPASAASASAPSKRNSNAQIVALGQVLEGAKDFHELYGRAARSEERIEGTERGEIPGSSAIAS